jgi:subtilase family serine protease
MSISIAPANRAAFRAYADAVSNPNSEEYRRWMTPQQVGERFGAPQATVDSVVSYLKSKGMTIKLVSDTRLAILFKGKVSAIESAFSTKINRYHAAATPSTRSDFYSYNTTPKVPASFASKVVSIGGIQNVYAPKPLTTTLTPAQSRGLYVASGLYASGNKGKGVTVGITNLGDGYRLSNLPIFYSAFGLPTPTGGVGSNVSKVGVAGVDGNTEPEGIETNLDIQMVLAEAPFANVVVYDGFGADLVSIQAREVQDNLIDIAAESWVFSADIGTLTAVNDQHVAMTLQGITYMAGTGDWGADESRGNYPHAYPDVIAIGGTDATVSDAQGTRQQEIGWFFSGAGWEPTLFDFNHLPAYQKGTTVPTNLDRRLFPDVSLQAAGSLMVAGGSVIGVGGTSSSGPQFAGQLALILETLKTEGAADSVGGHFRLGRINDLMYQLDGDPTVFWDVTQGDADNLLPDGTTPTSKVGWDYVTGWGAPICSGLHDAMLSLSSMTVTDAPASVNIFTSTHPAIVFGTQPQGGAAALPATDGVTYSVSSVKQTGVGQVAAVSVDVNLQTAKVRRAASVVVSFNSPNLTTGYIYLLNKNTNLYDLVSTQTGSGSMKSATIGLDVSSNGKYIQNDGSVKVLVRAMKPTRLGSTSFRLTVDQAVVVENVPRG